MTNFRTALRAASLTLLAGLAGLTVLTARAQTGTPTTAPPGFDPTYTPTLTFDVATIRPVDPAAGGAVHVAVSSPPHSSEFSATYFPTKALIQSAYGAPVVGGPDWITTPTFNIQAKSDAAANAHLAKLTDDQSRMEKQHMLQALLADRFALKAHWEIRETAVYELVLAKGGSKLHEVLVDPSSDPDHPRPPSAAADVKASGSPHGLEFQVGTANVRGIVGMLNSQLDRPILDKTGLTGNYSFTLKFGREWSAHDPDGYPDIFTAVQEQLGLKLEATKASIPVLVIDHIDQPSAN